MNGFSEGSIQTVRSVLRDLPQKNPHFHISMTTTCLQASFGYGEGIEIRYEDGRYVRTRQLERSTVVDACTDEAQAVAWFIQGARVGSSF